MGENQGQGLGQPRPMMPGDFESTNADGEMQQSEEPQGQMQGQMHAPMPQPMGEAEFKHDLDERSVDRRDDEQPPPF